jgi:Trp operon repressor
VCEPVADVVSIKCAVKNNDTIELRAELKMNASVYNQATELFVCGLTCDDEKRLIERAPIVVYFPDSENEPLWDIAKKYGTTVSAIAHENELSGETTEDVKVLFIPSA